jgi:hypothetical protein
MQTMPMQWRKGPRPDESVVALAKQLPVAAEAGQIRCMAVVTVSPTLEVEFVHAGELDDVRRNLLISGLTRLIRKLDV